jgi:alkylated DNA repair dioxygenase AlkB
MTQLDLFENVPPGDDQHQSFSYETKLSINGEVILYPEFFSEEESNQLFEDLMNQVQWKQEYITLYGKQMPIPRLTAWYGDEGKSYTYSGIEQHPNPWIPEIDRIKKKIEPVTRCEFNSVLINQYRDGRDSVSWHSDDEPELGENPVIASVSFGATRRFMLKHKNRKDLSTVPIDLTHGSLLLMQGETQHYWVHQVSKTQRKVEPRINLTFRNIIN